VIPSVAGETPAAAIATLTGAGFKVSPASSSVTSDVAKGMVVSTRPTGRAASGSTVTLILSSGPKMIAIPSVAGDSLAIAQQTLRQHGLTVSSQLDKVASTDAVGTVLGTNPAAGTTWPATKPVAIEVAGGAPLPNFVGQNIHDVQQWASQNHVRLNRQPARDSSLPRDIITRQSVPQGTAITPGLTVTVYVSNGPPRVHVPNVDGLTIEKATRRLEKAGFQVKVDQFFPIDKIYRYSPGGNQPRGTVITIYAGF
jgi:beta-lactam-binding protein with PASTA domain